MPYGDVYDRLYAANRDAASRARTRHHGSPRNGAYRDVFERYLIGELGAVWTPLMAIGSGCRFHLRVGEVPPEGRYVLRLSRHLTALVDGVVHDTYDPGRDGTRCLYGHWRLP